MGLWHWFWGDMGYSRDIGHSSDITPDVSWPVTNPATGMPMIGDSMAGVDVGGSPFGVDMHSGMDDLWSDTGGTDWSSCGCDDIGIGSDFGSIGGMDDF